MILNESNHNSFRSNGFKKLTKLLVKKTLPFPILFSL